MSLDAMDWVWTKSAAKGTARMVLLAIADKCPDDQCTAYAGTTMLVRRTHAARSSVQAAVDKLLDGAELCVVEDSTGPRGETVYHLPLAVGHLRALPEESRFRGPDPGPVQNPGRYGDRAPGGT
ncbi:helix-turn-helix domain-containing protein, partial [Streptomyces lasiicapitis]